METATEEIASSIVRLDIGIAREDYNELASISQELGLGLADYVANAIRVYTHIQHALANGRTVYLGRAGKPETILEIP